MEVRVKVTVVLPAGIVTVAGTVPAAVLSELRATTNPPTGALPEIVTVPVEFVPPKTDVGLKVRVVTTGAVTVNVAVDVLPLSVPTMLAVTSAGTITVVAVKVALVEPAGITTLAGTVTLALSDVRATVVPPAGAALLIVTVPVELTPPTTVVGLSTTLDRVGPVTVRVVV